MKANLTYNKGNLYGEGYYNGYQRGYADAEKDLNKLLEASGSSIRILEGRKNESNRIIKRTL